jgi:hypothetical protein
LRVNWGRVTLLSVVADPFEILLTVAGSLASAGFGVGVTYESMRSRIKAAETRASTAIEQTQIALQKIADVERWSTRQDGLLALHLERIGNLRKDADDLLATVFRSRFESQREMKAARQDIPRQDSDPVPPLPSQRGRLPSRRE